MNKKLILYVPLTVSVIVLAMIAVYTGAISLFLHDSSDDFTVMSTESISSKLEFSFDETIKGIPGESLIVSKANNIVKEGEPVTFKATFTLEDPDNSCVSSIDLKNSAIDGLIKDPASTNSSLIYYGTLSEEGGVTKNLGDLYAEFKTLGNEISNDSYKIKAEYTACQKDPKAIKEVLGIDTAGIYESLIK
jgi:hypothetical protein